MLESVDLLDCSVEPSDKQLQDLMQAMMDDVRSRAAQANDRLANTLRLEVSLVRHRYFDAQG